MKADVALLGGFPDTGDATLSDRNPPAFPTALDGGDVAPYVLFGENLQNVRIDGLIIFRGTGGQEGSGIRITGQSTDILIHQCTLHENGNVGIYAKDSTLKITQCILENNRGNSASGLLYKMVPLSWKIVSSLQTRQGAAAPSAGRARP
ncbi:MAG: right-handed parallel beta-helix repeat-containing protein [Candidatus Competibacteraceae bacterium]|nr:right-handed parallel beta-helix repeat-containing protein [Candidatus Competibacteraceae bacterium]